MKARKHKGRVDCRFWLCSCLAAACWVLGAFGVNAGESMLYSNRFDQVALGEPPAELIILDGAFTVKEENANQFLELPGAPLETFGALFGPAEKENWTVSARIQGTNSGRRAPSFGVGLNGVGGYRLLISPAKRQLELFKGDELLRGVTCAWTTGSWTWFRLRVRKTGETTWAIEGRAWREGDPEPAEWLLQHQEDKAPPPGRASLWGKPFSGTPIRFDDLSVSRLAN